MGTKEKLEDEGFLGRNGVWETVKQMEHDPMRSKMVLGEVNKIEANRLETAKECEQLRGVATHKGNSRTGHLRMLGEIPYDIWMSNQHLFGEAIPPEEQRKNIRHFFQMFGQYQVGKL